MLLWAMTQCDWCVYACCTDALIRLDASETTLPSYHPYDPYDPYDELVVQGADARASTTSTESLTSSYPAGTIVYLSPAMERATSVMSSPYSKASSSPSLRYLLNHRDTFQPRNALETRQSSTKPSNPIASVSQVGAPSLPSLQEVLQGTTFSSPSLQHLLNPQDTSQPRNALKALQPLAETINIPVSQPGDSFKTALRGAKREYQHPSNHQHATRPFLPPNAPNTRQSQRLGDKEQQVNESNKRQCLPPSKQRREDRSRYWPHAPNADPPQRVNTQLSDFYQRRYTRATEHSDFIVYHYIDLRKSWEEVRKAFKEEFGVDSKLEALRKRLQRANETAPAWDSKGFLLIDKHLEFLRPSDWNIKVVCAGLFERYPERALTYSWVPSDAKVRCEQLGKIISSFF